MGVLEWVANIFKPKAESDVLQTPQEIVEFLLKGGLNKSISGESVTPGNAMTVAAVYACVRVLSETIARIPLATFRRDSTDPRIKNREHNHWLSELLLLRPNRWQTAFEFKEMLMAQLLLRGNSYALKVMRGARILELIPIPPHRVQIKVDANNRISYLVTMRNSNEQKEFSQKAMFHIRGLTSDGFVGISPLQMARETIGGAMATQRHSAALFGNGAFPSGVLMHPGRLGKDGMKNLKESWDEQTKGDNLNSAAILEEGMEWKQTTMNNEDAQFLETREFQRSEIAAIFRVPPHMIGELKRATFSNIESQEISFISNSITPWAVRWEQAIWRDLVPAIDKQTLFARFILQAVMRGDSKARANFYVMMVQNGLLSPNEIRELEDRNPREGGDEFMTPLNMETPSDDETDDDTNQGADGEGGPTEDE